MKKVLFILASEGFRDAEYFVPAGVLKSDGHQIFVASDTKAGEIAKGADGNETIVNYNINDINLENFNAIVFVGGPGALTHLDNDISYNIAQKTIETGKLLAAICIAPTILAKSGILKGKKATVWSDGLDKSAIKILEENGATYIDKPIVKDTIITASGPSVAEDFGQALKQSLWETSA